MVSKPVAIRDGVVAPAAAAQGAQVPEGLVWAPRATTASRASLRAIAAFTTLVDAEVLI